MADSHYDRYMQQCVCQNSCAFPGSLELSRSFFELSQDEKVDKLRTILHAIGPIATEPTQNAKVNYQMKGNKLCYNGFLAIIQLSRATLQRHATEITHSNQVSSYKSKFDQRRQGKCSVQTEIVLLFLKRMSNLYGLPCPIGRNSSENNPVRYLPVALTRKLVFQARRKANFASC